MQVQRCSGAFMVSARRASMGLNPNSPGFALPAASPAPGALHQQFGASPALLQRGTPFAADSPLVHAGLAQDEGDLGELAEDEEYAAEEHAHQ